MVVLSTNKKYNDLNESSVAYHDFSEWSRRRQPSRHDLWSQVLKDMAHSVT